MVGNNCYIEIGENVSIYNRLQWCDILCEGNGNHIALPFISDGELAYLLAHARALLYPSLIEGFGYPPLEAMRYGTPVICSNVSSLPEIVGDAAITFSPLYESELYKAVVKFCNTDLNMLREKTVEQYKIISSRQINDLHLLIKRILQPKKE